MYDSYNLTRDFLNKIKVLTHFITVFILRKMVTMLETMHIHSTDKCDVSYVDGGGKKFNGLKALYLSMHMRGAQKDYAGLQSPQLHAFSQSYLISQWRIKRGSNDKVGELAKSVLRLQIFLTDTSNNFT